MPSYVRGTHGKWPSITPAEQDEIMERFRAGDHINDIHRATGWSFGTLKKIQLRMQDLERGAAKATR